MVNIKRYNISELSYHNLIDITYKGFNDYGLSIFKEEVVLFTYREGKITILDEVTYGIFVMSSNIVRLYGGVTDGDTTVASIRVMRWLNNRCEINHTFKKHLTFDAYDKQISTDTIQKFNCDGKTLMDIKDWNEFITLKRISDKI